MYIYMYIYVYTYMCVYVNLYMYAYVHECLNYRLQLLITIYIPHLSCQLGSETMASASG